jgi:BMFP domain-containing protein YqiC
MIGTHWRERLCVPIWQSTQRSLESGESKMQSENRMFDDLVKMMNGLAGTAAGMGREAQGSMREKMREWVGGMDFVSREEFDAVKAMAAAARDENEALAKRVAALEAGATPAAAKPKAAPRAKRGA